MSDQPKQSLYGDSGAGSDSDGQRRPMSLIDLISGVFSEPVETFKRLSRKPQWVGATVLLTALTLVLTIAWLVKLDTYEFMVAQIERAYPSMSSSDIEKAVEIGGKFMGVGAVIQALFIVPATIFLGALIYWCIGLLSREDPQWRPTYIHGLVVASVPKLVAIPYLLLGIFMAILQPVGTLRPDQIVPSSLAFWIETDNPKLSVLFGQIELFHIAIYIVFFLAVRHTLRTKTWGAALCVLLSLSFSLLSVLFAK